MQRKGSKWTGVVRLVPERLADPLKWRKPRRVFVNSMSDLFHESLSNEDIAAVFGVMAACPQHTFQILTKRPERMRGWFLWANADASWPVATSTAISPAVACGIEASNRGADVDYLGIRAPWPLPNVWLGVSAENQETADERIPLLLETPAAVRFVSYEPALGPVNFRRLREYTPMVSIIDALSGGVTTYRGHKPRNPNECGYDVHVSGHPPGTGQLDWIIAGSESGPGARPAELEWFRSVRDQCAAAGVAFFFKQWVGDKQSAGPVALDRIERRGRVKVSLPVLDGRQHVEWPR